MGFSWCLMNGSERQQREISRSFTERGVFLHWLFCNSLSNCCDGVNKMKTLEKSLHLNGDSRETTLYYDVSEQFLLWSTAVFAVFSSPRRLNTFSLDKSRNIFSSCWILVPCVSVTVGLYYWENLKSVSDHKVRSELFLFFSKSDPRKRRVKKNWPLKSNKKSHKLLLSLWHIWITSILWSK